jgi:predicted nucleic acid-binding protein
MQMMIYNIFKFHFNISIITKMEFLGFKKHSSETYKKAKKFLQYSNIYNLNDDIVDYVISLRRKYNIKLPDIIIASTAIINDCILVTRKCR